MASDGHRTLGSVAEIVGEDVDDLHHEVGVGSGETDLQIGDDWSRQGQVFLQHGCLKGEHVRPAGSKALVIVSKLDRLFRSVADAANVIADFDKRDIRLVAIAESFDMGSPYGRAMAQMASVFAELERAMIQERTRSAMSIKRARGERISGYAPFGWEFGRDGRLVGNAREQKVIAHVRRLRVKVLSYRGIATHLDREGVRPKRGRRWAHTTVKSMLTRNADWPGTDGGPKTEHCRKKVHENGLGRERVE